MRGSPGPKLWVMCKARYSRKVFWKHKKSYSHYCRHQNHFDINCERRLKTMTHKELSITIFKQSSNLKNTLVHPRIPHPEENTKKELPRGKKCKTRSELCNSENFTYELQCQQCPAQYIGLTSNNLRTMMNDQKTLSHYMQLQQ